MTSTPTSKPSRKCSATPRPGCTHYACLGDIVGYNANPRECLEIVRSLDCPVIKGNHDEECSRETPLEGLNPLAFAALNWTRSQMRDKEKEYLRGLRLVRQVTDFTIVHATLDSPGGWAYVQNKFDAMASFNYQFTGVCFFGHTHVPVAYVQDGAARPEKVEVENTLLKHRTRPENISSMSAASASRATATGAPPTPFTTRPTRP